MRKLPGSLLLLIVFLLLTNCKEGVEDESFKLLTRINKISQTWTVTDFTVSGEDALVQNTSFVINDGECMELEVVIRDSSRWTFRFKEEGSYEEKKITYISTLAAEDSISNECAEILTERPKVVEIDRNGIWQFNEDGRNADQLFLYEVTSEYSVLWQIEELDSEALILSRIYKNDEAEIVEERLVMNP